MAEPATVRAYLLLAATPKLLEVYRSGDDDAVWAALVEVLQTDDIDVLRRSRAVRIIDLPSLDWTLCLPEKAPVTPQPEGLVYTMAFATTEAADRFRAAVESADNALILGFGTDIAIEPADHWCPGGGAGAMFGDRHAARALIGAGCLAERQLTGEGVNVVVVDQGIDPAWIPDNYGGAWRRDGCEAPPPASRHGRMVVRNIINVAPRASIFDCPLIPAAIGDVMQFVSQAQAAYGVMLADIARAGSIGLPPGPWIFVNAWAVYSRALEYPPGSYTNNLAHPFNAIIGSAVDQGRDVVFAAGNCGQFCPSARCGSGDSGPGQSIHGANGHPQVITAGAVRVDGTWLGYASQGPGPTNMPPGQKPDLCAPSQFHEPGDAFAVNTGSSTACALIAGVVAALRTTISSHGPLGPTPYELKATLLGTARGTGGQWNHRLGFGTIDAEAVCRDESFAARVLGAPAK